MHLDLCAMAVGDGLRDGQPQSTATLYARFGRWLLPARDGSASSLVSVTS
ncbi:hypothetical protein [Synechococcus sp. BS55D]|nr:hypothetical protein [Synechococcus sp. BS55D]